MILPDDTPASPTKSRAGPLSEVVDEEYPAPPPAYPGHSAPRGEGVAPGPSTSHPSTPLVLPRPHYHPVERVEHAPRRFLKAFGFALLIYLTIGSFVRSAIIVVHRNDMRTDPPPGGGVPEQQDGKVKHCIRASAASGSWAAHTTPNISFHLPLSADALYIFGRGSLSSGSITFSPTDDHSVPHDQVQVDIDSTHGNRAALDLVNICVLQRAHGEMGIGILVSNHSGRNTSPGTTVSTSRGPRFSINVRFPVARGRPLRVKAFETNLPMFEHTLADLHGEVHFDSVSLSSKSMPINGHSLEADTASLLTSNSHITGSFYVSRSLFMQTSNKAISANVTLYHDGSRPYYSNLTMLNSNAAIDGFLHLHSTAPSGTGGQFDVLTRTENSALTFAVTAQPVASTLLLDARTRNAPAAVELPAAFEGTFGARTTNARADVECDAGARDPAGLGRRRTCAVPDLTVHEVSGWTSWGGARHGMGDVNVVSVNAPVRLTG
ncbi:hypothetical protein BD413DRAFT_606343 [Trametes elegans]|nr:hypothetical protein BD413DRAFT_606343 [Trametes elegans]